METSKEKLEIIKQLYLVKNYKLSDSDKDLL